MTTDLALIAERRGALAALLGLLLLEEPGPGLADLVADLPALAPLGSGDADIATEYERVFLRGVPLYESVFRSDDGQHGGEILAACVDDYQLVEFDEHDAGRWRVAGADHLGIQLRCYARLCLDEAGAWRAETPDRAMSSVETERAFLANHVAPWATVAVDAAIELACDGPYRQVLEAVAELLAEEYDRLRPAPSFGGPGAADPLPANPLPANLGHARLARLLLAPATCGTWLSPAVIAAASRSIGAPWRPSDTRAALRHLIETAAATDDLSVVLAPLAGALGEAAGRHRESASQSPGNAENALRWAATAAEMLALVERIAELGLRHNDTTEVVETLSIGGLDAGELADAVDTVVDQLRSKGFRVDRQAVQRPIR
ncbi:MAG: molecular chaperone TorD family protein [Actinomycetota bacterium]